MPWHDATRGSLPNRGAASKKPRRVRRAVSMIGFAVDSFYHFVAEGLARLAEMRMILESDPGACALRNPASLLGVAC